MDFNTQHKQIERIVRKHWDIVRADSHLSAILPEKPRFKYRRAPTLRDHLAKKLKRPPTKKKFSFFEGKGYYPCKSCYATSTVTIKEYVIEDLISCRTEGLVYLLECPCQIQYIGRTKRELWKRLREHVQNIKKWLCKT